MLEYYHKHGDKQTLNSKNVPLELDYLRPVIHTSFVQLTKEAFEIVSACALCGAVFAPLKEPKNCLASHLKEIVKKTDATTIFVDNKAILEQLLLIKENLLVVYIGDASDFETIKYGTLHIISWAKFLGYAKEKTDELYERLQSHQNPYDLAYIVYRADDGNTFKGCVYTMLLNERISICLYVGFLIVLFCLFVCVALEFYLQLFDMLILFQMERKGEENVAITLITI